MNFCAPLILLSKSRFIFLSLLIVRTEINPTVQETSHSSLLSPGIKRVYWNPQIGFILWYQWCLLDYSSLTVQCDQCRQSVRSTGLACLFFILSASIVSAFWLLLSCHFESLMPQIIVCSLYARLLLLPAASFFPSATSHFLPKKNITLPSQLAVFTFLCSFPLFSWHAGLINFTKWLSWQP